jgi:IS30 family transposase
VHEGVLSIHQAKGLGRGRRRRGSNENTNGLLGQYMPKGMDISAFSQTQLNAIARQLNERPRKTLGFHTPAELLR